MYLQIIHKTQSKDLKFYQGLNQSCQSGIEFYSILFDYHMILSYLIVVSKV
jgi:hypothetical protein